MKTKGFTSACKEFFRLKEEQTLIQFAAELKQLTPEDKAEMAPLLAVALGLDAVTL